MSAHNSRRIIITLIIVVISAIAFIKLAVLMLPLGSYGYAENYSFSSNERDLMAAIENLKSTHPEYNIPDSEVIDQRSNFEFHFYIYNNAQNKILHFCTRSIDSNSTELLFIGVNNGLELGNWKEINHQYKGKENSKIKKEFQEKVLDQLGIQYKDNGNSNKLLGIQF